jgi:HAE1 family hydrophobic/amphiphilic exporter-1
MLSARMKTPPAARSTTGLIPRMQSGYGRILRWTLEHRGWSVLGILLIIGVSVVPMTKTKFDMFGGGSGGEAQIYYQWQGSYSKNQMLEEVVRVEDYLNRNRERFHITQLYSWYSEQGGASTMVTFDEDKVQDTKPLTDIISKELPKSARAELGIEGQGDQGGGGGGKNVQVQLVGDSTEMLTAVAKDVIPLLSTRKELRDVRVDAGDQNTELNVRVDRERAAAARTRYRCGCVSPVPKATASRTSPASRCVRRTGAVCRC